MKLTIDNLAGLGALDYSSTVCADSPKIVRALNEPSTLEATLCLEGSGLAVPVRRARITATSDAGALLFTGYFTTEPVSVYAGAASEGSVYRLAVRAVSDEWLLDKQSGLTGGGASLEAGGGSALDLLLNRYNRQASPPARCRTCARSVSSIPAQPHPGRPAQAIWLARSMATTACSTEPSASRRSAVSPIP